MSLGGEGKNCFLVVFIHISFRAKITIKDLTLNGVFDYVVA